MPWLRFHSPKYYMEPPRGRTTRWARPIIKYSEPFTCALGIPIIYCTQSQAMDQTIPPRLHMYIIYMRKLNWVGKEGKYSVVYETNVHMTLWAHIFLMFIATITYPTKHQKGRSALLLAAKRGHVEVMKVLMERGAHVNIQDEVIVSRNLHYTSLVPRSWCAPAQKEGLVTCDEFSGLAGYIRLCNIHQVLRSHSHVCTIHYTCI